jgi:hypothetical protein
LGNVGPKTVTDGNVGLFSHIIPALVRQIKQEKIQKNDLWGLCPGLISVKMDLKIFKKKQSCTWYPRRAAQKKNKSAGYYLRGLSGSGILKFIS